MPVHYIVAPYSEGPGKSTALLSAPDSAFRPNVMLACFRFPPQCDIGMLPAGGEWRKVESTLTLAERRAVNLP
jgi:hypothetical protein